MVTGDDGNIYILRRTSPALVFVISPSGEVLRRLEVQPPTDSALPSALQVVKGQLLVRFSTASRSGAKATSHLVVANSTSGETISIFDTSKGMGSAMACFEPPSTFTFAKEGEGGKLILDTYEPN